MNFIDFRSRSFFGKRINILTLSLCAIVFSATAVQAQMYPPPGNNMIQNPQYPGSNYMANSSAFKQEIARVEINVSRQGKAPLPITAVPRLEKDDVLRVRLLEEQVNGLKPDQSNFDWTFLVAFVNPGRKNDAEKTLSQEINFRKQGWYKEHTFVVPYDSQPIFFIYPKPQYRGKILSLIDKNQDEIRKIGEKTIEISDAYAKIGSFLNELQSILIRNSYGMYGGYGGYGNYGYYNNNYGYGVNGSTASRPFNSGLFMEQAVEQMAKSFNIQLPTCWGNNQNYYGGYPNNGVYGNYGGYGAGGFSSDFVGRIQCVARSVRVEDLDISISRMLQQGGALAVAQLAQKYPQIAFWINIAASALDFIMQITKKAPLKIVPTVITTSGGQGQYALAPNMSSPGARAETVKISLFAETQPNSGGFVTAYPLVINKWQANSDPNIINLPIPALADSCLHPGQNILRSTDIMNDWMSDVYTKDFKLVVSSTNGFVKEFPLRKNIGLSGWELNLTKEEFDAFPKINMNLNSEIVGQRGFNEIRSPKFQLAISTGGTWEIVADSQKTFAAGAKRIVRLKNSYGGCRCLQAVIYKPSFGGQFVYEAGNAEHPLLISPDGNEASFEVDATDFQPGPGQLQLRGAGAEAATLNIILHPKLPEIGNVKISKGDTKAVIVGERLEQIQAIKINGKRAVAEKSNMIVPMNNSGGSQSNAFASSEKSFAFEDAVAHLDTNSFAVELELESGGVYAYPKTFNVSPARPVLVSKQIKEIEAIASGNKIQTQFALETLPVFPIDSAKISLIVQNALTDYDFKVENIEIETRIENGYLNAGDLPKASFEVLDWKNMQITFQLNESLQTILGGRRLQFRIRDKARGDSDWYTIGKTFARLPSNIAIRCASRANENCQMTGTGVEYISQVSVDGGKTWYPQAPASLTVQPTANGEKAVMIPRYSNKNLLQIKLRDFPMTEGVPVHNYNFVFGGK